MEERTRTTRRLFEGRILALDILEIERPDGVRASRELVRHAPAVGVLPRLPDGTFLLVRQFRKAIETELLEICAGLVDPGENAEAAARRELAEETGCAATRLERLGRLYASPGYTDETVEIFFAECAEPDRPPAPDPDEHVTVQRADAEGIETMIRDGRLADAKSVAAWQLYRMWAGREA